jgi:hypothetical protein
METSNPNPGSTIINVGGRQLGVLFPHGVLPAPDLENMLSLISQFVAAWNAATPVSSFARPFLPDCLTRIFRIRRGRFRLLLFPL